MTVKDIRSFRERVLREREIAKERLRLAEEARVVAEQQYVKIIVQQVKDTILENPTQNSWNIIGNSWSGYSRNTVESAKEILRQEGVHITYKTSRDPFSGGDDYYLTAELI